LAAGEEMGRASFKPRALSGYSNLTSFDNGLFVPDERA
jgi:hypothetical protein